MKFDLHVHSNLSYDADMTTSELVEAAKKKGLTGVAVCDHNAFRIHRPRKDFYMIPACEFSTDAGHLIVYFQKEHINESLPRDEHDRFYWRDICKAAHEQGALVFLAHPYAPLRERSDALFREIDGIEIFNARVVHSRKKNANEDALTLCRKLDKPFSAGSDAHCPSEVGATYWECDLPDSAIDNPDFEEKLKEALLNRRGRVFAGAASPFDVLRCKRFTYRRERLWGRLMKSYLYLIITAVKSVFTKKFESHYINVEPYVEEEPEDDFI